VRTVRRTLWGVIATLQIASVMFALAAQPPGDQPESDPIPPEAVSKFEQRHPEAVPIEPGIDPPRLLWGPDVVIPYWAKKVKEPGSKVMVEAVINEKGRVSAAVVLRAERREFFQPVIKAVRGWTYRPAMKEGKPITVFLRTVVTIPSG
jgi:TonB family protein